SARSFFGGVGCVSQLNRHPTPPKKPTCGKASEPKREARPHVTQAACASRPRTYDTLIAAHPAVFVRGCALKAYAGSRGNKPRRGGPAEAPQRDRPTIRRNGVHGIPNRASRAEIGGRAQMASQLQFPKTSVNHDRPTQPGENPCFAT